MCYIMIVYTDGSCLGNPGKGGWAFVHVHDDGTTSRFGSDGNTTNNIMEMTAIVEALHFAAERSAASVKIFSDSTYCINGIQTWMEKWKKNGWKTSSNKCVKNEALWREIDELLQKVDATFEHVKAHSTDRFNNMVDKLAREAATLGSHETA